MEKEPFTIGVILKNASEVELLGSNAHERVN